MRSDSGAISDIAENWDWHKLPPRAIKPLLVATSVTGFENSADVDQPEDERNPLTSPERGSIPVAFPISHGAVIIDFCGPWEVFHSADIPGRRGEVFQTYTVAETLEPITASGGMKIVSNYTFETAPAPKVVVIPGQADPTRAVLNWVRSIIKGWVIGVALEIPQFTLRRNLQSNRGTGGP
jgi:hypothetical protein